MRNLVMLAVLGLLQGFWVVTTSLAGSAVMRVEDKTVAPGAGFEVPVLVAEFTQITSAQFTLQWNPAVLQYDATGGYGLAGLGAGNFGTNQTGNGKLTFSWDDPAAAGVTKSNNTVIFWVRFNALGSAGTNSLVSFTDVPTLREVSKNFAVTPCGFQDGVVGIQAATEAPKIILSVERPVNGQVELRWSAELGAVYEVVFKDQLSDPTWTSLGQISSVGDVVSFSDSMGTKRQQFYQIKQVR